MNDSNLYKDIAERTGGDIYIGVVGPVRTGKSTFIHKFIETALLPAIDNEFDRARTTDEIPQSASGRTVMTTEPKFIPDESVKIKTEDGTELNIKLIDCVGYMIDGALGVYEDGIERSVMTPWSDTEMSFTEAAELGTSKVIGEHSTIGILVTTDGTIGEIERAAYVSAEERVVSELRALGKPFAIILNSREPESEEAQALAVSLEEKYKAPVALLNCTALNRDDVREILKLTLSEFPIKRMSFKLPPWITVLPKEHPERAKLISKIKSFTEKIEKLGDIDRAGAETEGIEKCSVSAKDGSALFELPATKEDFYAVMSEESGLTIPDDRALFASVLRLSEAEREFRKIEAALKDAREKGYGIVMPEPSEVMLEEPRLTKGAGGYGVRVAASADSIHMIKAGIKTELCPVVGTEEQTEEVVKYLLDEIASDPKKVWESNMFGKSLYDLVSDGLNSKLQNIPDDSREKIGETIERVVNEGANGLICILL